MTLVDEFFGKHVRRVAYKKAMDDLCDPSNAPQPGGPWVTMTVEERRNAMLKAKFNLTDEEMIGEAQADYR